MMHLARRQEGNSRFGTSNVVVRETDDYVNRKAENGGETEPPNKLIYNLFQPAVVTILIACITWSVAQSLAPLTVDDGTDPVGNALFLWAISVIMTFIGFKTQRAVHGRFAADRLLSGNEATKARIIELALLFIGVKLLNHLGDTVPELLRAVRGWGESPATFFDTRSVVAYGLGAIGWIAAGLTARDIDELMDPLQAGASAASGETDPRHRVVNRYFIGGAVLLFFTAMNRVNIGSFVQQTHGRIRAPIGNVLLYYFLGILMLGQVQWMRLTVLWNRQKVRGAADLAPTWLRYTLIFVGIAALLAFLLPTGYTVGILDLVSMAILLISYLVTMLYLLILWPFILLLSLFTGNLDNVEPPQMERLPFTPPPDAMSAGGNAWWAVARSVLFWITLVAVVVYLIRSYIRDRPELMEAIRSFKPWQWLNRVWRGLRQWLASVGHKLPGVFPGLMRRLRNVTPRRRAATKRVRGLSAREQIIYHYITTLDRAREWGLARRQTETPYEYRSTLAPNLDEGQVELDSLTEAFVAARYSTHDFTPEEVQAQAANAASLQQQLEDERRDRQNARPQEGPKP